MSTEIGQKLRRMRQARNLSLEDVSRATFMRVHYLAALEEGNFNALPSLAQARGFLRAYAEYLGMEPENLLAELQPEGEPAASSEDHQPKTAEAQPPPDLSAQQVLSIFREIGQKLSSQREMLGLTLEDVSRHTHLRVRFLESIETGDFEALPSMVQGRGMLNNYASFLGMNPEPLLLRFADALQARLAARRPQAEKQPPLPIARPPSLLRRVFSRETVLTALLTVAFFVFLLWGIIRVIETRTSTPLQPTAPSIADVLLATATATDTPTPELPTQPVQPGVEIQVTEAAVEELPLQTVQAGVVQVYLTVRQRTWMRVVVDGKVEFDGRALAGSAYQFSGDQQVEVLTGNGAAVQVFFQGQDLGPLGNMGEVINQVYTLEGVRRPTETITPTPTETLIPSPTVPPTPTP